MSKGNIKIIQIDTNPAVKSIKDLRNELKQYKDQMANLEEGSDAFLEIANKAGEVKHQIDEINESIKGSSADFGDMVGNVSNVAAGLIGAFEAVAGGLQAIGVESEAIDETIKRMQGLMALVQGLSAIDDGVKSFDKLTASMGAAGVKLKSFIIGLGKLAAPIAVVGALGAAFVKLKNWIDGTSTALNNRTIEQNKFNKSLQKELEIRKRAGFTEEETLLFEISQYELRNQKLTEHNKKLKAEIDLVNKNSEAARNGASIFGTVANQAAYQGVQQASNINVGQNTALIAENTIEINKNAEALAGLKDELDIIIKARELAAQRAQQIVVNDPSLDPLDTGGGGSTETSDSKDLGLVEFTDQELKEGLERVKQYWEEVYNIKLEQLKRSGKTEKELIEGEIEIEKQRLTLYEEGTLEHEKQLTKLFELEKELGALATETTEVITTQYDHMRKAGDAFFDGLKKTATAFSDSSLGLSSQWIDSLDQFQEAFKQTMDIVSKEGKAGWQSYGNVAATALGGIGTLLNAISQDQDVSTKKGFEQQKKLQIAATTMNMLAGIMAAWTSSMALPAPASFIVGAVQSAATAALGGVQIAKIKSQTLNSATASGAINPTAVNSMVIPPVQYSSAVQGASTEGAIKDTKVYVTESDIASTMNKVSVQESENTY